jgi:pimeloyl-ACP methyl ester carboxylesterase
MENTLIKFSYPVGYHDFHKNKSMNFQLNRWHSIGFMRREDIIKVAPKISDFQDWKDEMITAAETAAAEDRMMNAAFFYRAAEFFTHTGDVDKKAIYDRFIDLFYKTIKDDKFEKHTIPYEDSFMPALRFMPEKSRGVILLHGGLDSFIEEFYSIASIIVYAGYELIMFEGPGQGGALRNHGLTMTHEWEKPVAAVLDFFHLTDVTLIGVSLGGYLAPRAAAFEPRIARVIAFDVSVYDNMSGLPERLWHKLISMAPELYNHFVRFVMKKNLMARWLVDQWMYVSGTSTPFEWALQLVNYSLVDIAPLISQDVLILAGAEDHMVPLKNYYAYKKGLVNARSLTGRIFTRDEQAHNHCQIGNIRLALQVILDWVQAKS